MKDFKRDVKEMRMQNLIKEREYRRNRRREVMKRIED